MFREVDLDKRRPRLTGAIETLPDIARAELNATLKWQPETKLVLSEAQYRMAAALLRHVSEKFDCHQERGTDRTPDGKPQLRFNAEYQIVGITDCVGNGDTETAVRIAVQELGLTKQLGIAEQHLKWFPVEGLSPAAAEGALTSLYNATAQKQNDSPSFSAQVVVLVNTAPRGPDDPDAKACSFDLVLTKQNIIILTTNNNWRELRGLGRAGEILEVWRTALGEEDHGTQAGKKPRSIFRSQDMLSLIANLHAGDSSLLLNKVEIPAEWSDQLETVSVDSFGNIKLNEIFNELCERLGVTFGDKVLVTIGKNSHVATIAHSHGDGHRGELLLVPSSSPKHPTDPTITGADLVLNGGRAINYFPGPANDYMHTPLTGRHVTIERVKKTPSWAARASALLDLGRSLLGRASRQAPVRMAADELPVEQPG